MAVPVREVVLALQGPLKLRLVTGARGLGRMVEAPRIQKPALALAGYLAQLHPGRVQVLGNAELGYLNRLGKAAADAAADQVGRAHVACFVVTNDNPVPPALQRAAGRHRVPLFTTPLRTANLIRGLTRWLEDRFAPETTVHGVLMEILGLGVLLLGKSGVGKSEAALALLARGHRLVADDVVLIHQTPAGTLRGHCAQRLRHHMEIRGLGVLNVEHLFGVLATLEEAPIQLVVELVEPTAEHEPDRLGIDDRTRTLLGVDVPEIQMQVRPGRDLATILEVAARNQLLKQRGIHAAKDFVAILDRDLKRKGRPVAKGRNRSAGIRRGKKASQGGRRS